MLAWSLNLVLLMKAQVSTVREFSPPPYLNSSMEGVGEWSANGRFEHPSMNVRKQIVGFVR